jgi:ribosomal protein S12 methylthiotransferase
MADGLILPYLDIPLQHANTRVLKAMKRPAATENTLRRIEQWRAICPDITLRSTFIVGFPGETEAEFEELLQFLAAAQLDRVGCFTYSPVDGAVANELSGAVPEEIKAERYARFMEVQARISAARLQAKIGRTLAVIVDELDGEGATGRSMADAPEIDGQVFIDTQDIQVGDIVEVRITDASEHDLFGVMA